MVRALAVFHVSEQSGPSLSLEPILRWLAAEHELEIMVPSGDTPTGGRLAEFAPVRALNYEALQVPKSFSQIVRMIREVATFRKELRRSRPVLVLAVTTRLPALLVAARLERIPVVVYAAELIDHSQGRTRVVFGRWIMALTGKYAAGILCCSGTVAEQFTKVDPAQMRIIYPVVDEERCVGGNGEMVRNHFGIPSGAPCVAVIGNISRGRGQDLVVRALQDLPGVHLLIIGEALHRRADHTYMTELTALVEQLSVSDRVVFAGQLTPIADALAATDVVVNPAVVPEAFGRVAIEAMLAGVPVVSARVGAVPEILTDDHDALLVEPGDSRALATAINRLLQDQALAARLIVAGRERASGFTDSSRAVDRMVALLDHLKPPATG